MNYPYTIIIQWSEEDQCYVVSLPEWGEFCHTHGATYAEAFENAMDVLSDLVESTERENEALPNPMTYKAQAPALLFS